MALLPRQQLALFLAVVFVSGPAVAAAQPITEDSSASPVADSSSSTSSGGPAAAGVGIKVSFRPRVAIVVGIFTMIFSLTFLLLMYAKFCHPSSSSSSPPAVAAAADSAAAAAAPAPASVEGGVPKQVVESLPFFRFGALRGARQGMECSVCLARFDDADLLRLLPRCRHAFHLHCVDRWLQTTATCPLCRTAVDADKYPSGSGSSARIVLGGDALLSSASGRSDDNSAAAAAAAGTGTAARTGSGRDLLDIFVERVPGQQPQAQDEDTSSKEKKTTTATMPSSQPPPELDRYKHRIIVNDVVFKSRWSDLNSADLVALDTEMLRDDSGRFMLPPGSPYYYSNDHEAQQAPNKDDDDAGIIVPPSRKRLLEPAVVVDAAGCGGSAVSASAARMISSGVRSMSEVVSLPRLRAAARDRLSEEDNRRWLPIARRTARWFAGRASSRGHEQEEEEEHPAAVHVVPAAAASEHHDDNV